MLITRKCIKLPVILQSKIFSYVSLNLRLLSRMAQNRDNRLDTFRKVCDDIAAESGYKAKAEILASFFKNGSEGSGFKGDLLLWVQMLIPQNSQRVYNLKNKQMLKLFGRIFQTNLSDMNESLEQEGDVSVVLSRFFQQSKSQKPQSKSEMYLQDVDVFLMKLEQVSKEDDQCDLLLQLCKQASVLDLKMVIRLIKQDLRINARARHILDAFGPKAYESYQASRDLKAVVEQFGKIAKPGIPKTVKASSVTKLSNINVMTPISPMLANACKSVDEAFRKSPEGLYSEIKYDGERVQIHKKGNEFRFFSRNLKPVMEHKVRRFKEFIPKAFPGGGDMILDSEIILVDKISGDLLPFGSLGVNKKKEFATAEVCLFVFDCILFNGENLTHLEFKKRRKILEDNISPIKSYVQLSESYFLKTRNELSLMTAKVLKANLEGVVLKNPGGIYQPGKRGWLKVKKDYLFDGKMADSADLVVLGAWFGSGKKGGILSIFLMCCYDPRDHLWKTVTKVHSGLDDATNEEIHNKLIKLMQRPDVNKLPMWFLCKKPLVPDFVACDPHKMPVWEITGAEFTKSEAHTASGISIRFPRITRLRDDKSADNANDLPYIEQLYETSKKEINVDLLMACCDSDQSSVVKIESKLNMHGSLIKNAVKLEHEENSSGGRRKQKTAEAFVEAPVNKIPKLSQVESKVKNALSKQDTKKDLLQQNLKTSPIKQQKLNFSSIKNSKSNFNEIPNIFNNINAYFEDSLSEARKDLVEAFCKSGGTIFNNAKSSDIVFHHIPTKKLNLIELRKKFNPNCHHLTVKWVKDSLRAKECLPFAVYALLL